MIFAISMIISSKFTERILARDLVNLFIG